ncbi:hypothetical protein JXA84_08940 [candidate division WOR-3 bacterium]|nr:hypothetical protein [candidate division WOR-3 bacterium]
MGILLVFIFVALCEGGVSRQLDMKSPSLQRSAHDNNNLWTGLDLAGGDIGSATGPSMQFPGGTGINTLYQGCQAIGFYNGSYPIVVGTQLC